MSSAAPCLGVHESNRETISQRRRVDLFERATGRDNGRFVGLRKAGDEHGDALISSVRSMPWPSSLKLAICVALADILGG